MLNLGFTYFILQKQFSRLHFLTCLNKCGFSGYVTEWCHFKQNS